LESEAAFGTKIFRVIGGYLRAGASFLRGLQKGFSEFVISWKQAEILVLTFPTKRQPNTVKIISAHTKCTDLIFRTIKKIFIS
jgi:hypothetical protein